MLFKDQTENSKHTVAGIDNFGRADYLNSVLVSSLGTHGSCDGTNRPAALTFAPAFKLDFVKRLLGKKEGKALTRATRRRLDALRGSIPQFMAPRVTYTVQPINSRKKGAITLGRGIELRSAKLSYSLKKAHSVIGFVATVGSAIDARIKELMASGKMADAYIVDALGSGAAEHAADSFQNEAAAELEKHGQTVGLRFSPGYCDWPVSEQKKLFPFIDNDAVGVFLDESALMTPRKSISAVFGIYDRQEAPDLKNHNPCLYCTKKDCIARRTTRNSNN